MANKEPWRTQPNIKILLEPEDHPPVSPGSFLFVNLTVVTNRPIQLFSSTLTFKSRGTCTRLTRPQRDSHTAVNVKDEVYSVSNISRHHTPPCDGKRQVLPIGHPKVAKVHFGETLTTSSTFSIRLMMAVNEDVPDTWYHDMNHMYSARVQNTVEAEVSYRRLDNFPNLQWGSHLDMDGQPIVKRYLRAEHDVVIKNCNVPVENFGITCIEAYRSVTSKDLPSPSSGLVCQLTVRDRLGRLSHDLPLMVKVNNRSTKLIHTVSLTLYQEYTFTLGNPGGATAPLTSTETHTEKVRIRKVSLPGVQPRTLWQREITGFNIPERCLTRASLHRCTFVRLRHFVRLKVKWFLGTLKCDVEVYLGTQDTRGNTLPGLLLPTYHIQG